MWISELGCGPAARGQLRREAGDDPRRQVDLGYRLTLAQQICRVIFNLNEFAYVD